MDIRTIPPGTTERREFFDLFCIDLANIMNIDDELIEVVSIRPATKTDWMSILEFFVEFGDLDQAIEIEEEFYHNLEGLIIDPSSELYSGEATRRIDPSYVNVWIEEETSPVDLFLKMHPNVEDDIVAQIVDTYQEDEFPEDSLDLSSMQIYVQFDEIVKGIQVPNPRMLRFILNFLVKPFFTYFF